MNYPSLQIVLYESRRFSADSNRMLNQIMSRGFKYVPNADDFVDVTLLPVEREYLSFGPNMQDNLFIQEEMGLGVSTGSKVAIIDFSDCLAELLAIKSGEDPARIRSIREYSYISHCLTSMYTDKDDFSRFDIIFRDDLPCVMAYLSKFCSKDKAPSDILREVLCDIHEELNKIMKYTAKAALSQLQREHDIKVTLRSRSFNKLIFSTSDDVNYDLELIDKDRGVVLRVPVRTFKRGEYDVDYKERIKC